MFIIRVESDSILKMLLMYIIDICLYVSFFKLYISKISDSLKKWKLILEENNNLNVLKIRILRQVTLGKEGQGTICIT